MNELSMNTANAMAGLLGTNNTFQEHLHKASGIEGMNTFATKPSSETVIFEANSDIFCIKVTDSNNNPTSCRYFAFREITREEAIQEISPYIMKGELESVKEDLRSFIRSEFGSLKEELLNAKQSIRSNQSSRFENSSSKQSTANRIDSEPAK